MFVKYEKSFKKILSNYYSTSQRTFPLAAVNVPKHEADYLAAQGFLTIVPYVFEEENCRISITDRGLTYFDDKRDKWLRFIIPICISLLSLLVSIMALVVSWLTYAEKSKNNSVPPETPNEITLIASAMTHKR